MLLVRFLRFWDVCSKVTSLDHFLSNFVTLNSISYYTSTLTVFLDESSTFAMVLRILWVGFSELHKKINFYKVSFRKAYISLSCYALGTRSNANQCQDPRLCNLESTQWQKWEREMYNHRCVTFDLGAWTNCSELKK